MNIAIYSRKSIETNKGESVKNQVKLCKEYFERQDKNCKFEVFEDEGFSGGNINRPAFKRMMELVKIKQFDVVAVYKIDRIARNIVDFVNIYDELENIDVQLVSITEGFDPRTAAGKMMMLLLASFAEMERMNIAQRVKDNMKELAKIGRWSGGTPPTGYTTEKVLEIGKNVTYLKLIETTSKDIKKMFEMYSIGHSTYQISKFFKNKGINYPQKTIQNILTNPTYLKATKDSTRYLENQGYIVYGEPNGCGFLPYNRRPKVKGRKVKGDTKFVAISVHEGVIDIDLWMNVQQRLKENKTDPHPRESNFSFLAGLVKCKCGSNMVMQPGKMRKDNTRIFYFRCRSKNCKNKFLRVDIAEEYIFKTLKKYLHKEHIIESVQRKNDNLNLDKDIKLIEKKIDKNDKAIDSLVDKLVLLSNEASLPITKRIENLTVINNNLKEELLTLERKKHIDNLNSVNIDLLHNQITQFFNLKPEADIEIKKNYIKTIVKSIIWDSEKNTIKLELLI